MTLKAEPVFKNITISPPSMEIEIGKSLQFTSECKDQHNEKITCPTLTWKTKNESVAGVNGSGLVTGNSVGSTMIMAGTRGEHFSNMVNVVVKTVSVPKYTMSPTIKHTNQVNIKQNILSTVKQNNQITPEQKTDLNEIIKNGTSYMKGPEFNVLPTKEQKIDLNKVVKQKPVLNKVIKTGTSYVKSPKSILDNEHVNIKQETDFNEVIKQDNRIDIKHDDQVDIKQNDQTPIKQKPVLNKVIKTGTSYVKSPKSILDNEHVNIKQETDFNEVIKQDNRIDIKHDDQVDIKQNDQTPIKQKPVLNKVIKTGTSYVKSPKSILDRK